MEKLIPFLCDLEEIGRHYTLGHHGCGVRPGAITVHVTASAVERWEVEFFEDGYVEIERFGSVGGVEDSNADVETLLAELRADT
jgi:hypothetical protein